ncbi:MAG: MFS transporter, partial [Deltaproteobacteria bacterium]|nr:MFS transporter [Deltaproteobacteria bacterium]
LEEGNSEDWFSSDFIIACALAAAVGTTLFVWRQMTVKYPVVDLRVLRHRSLAGGSMLSMVVGMGLYGATFAVPIFTQSILHFTAQQTGLLLLPGALASAFMFPLMGKANGKIDARILIAIGASVIAAVMMWMCGIMTPQTGADDFFWPLIVRGAATVLMYLPLTLATLGPIPKKEVAAASGFYSLTRQLGGSVGIAVLTMLLTRRNAWHRSVLMDKLQLTSAAVQERVSALMHGFMAKGASAEHALAQAYKVLDGSVSLQAAVLSFGDIFFVVGVAFVAALPLVFLLGSGKGAKVASDAH